MSFPRYSIYRPSAVEWLGEVPQHWKVLRLKHACEVFPSNVDKHAREDEPPVHLCNYTDVYYNERITADMAFMEATASEEQIARFTLRGGDTIITKDSETADDIAIAAYVPEDLPGVVCGYHLSMVRPRGATCGSFVKRLFDSVYAKAKFEITANGLTRVGLGQYSLDNVELPFPPAEEQQAIASFLDRETAKIDALVEEQKRLIELLKEKRHAVISQAVTKGLDPSVPVKDSGVEWLGNVPLHWAVRRLKHVCSTTSGGTPNTAMRDAYYTDETGIPWVRTMDLSNDVLRSADIYITARALEDTACKLLPVGTVMVAMYGGEGTVGKNGLLAIPAAINQAVCGLLPSNDVDPEYLLRYMQFYRPYWMIEAESSRKDPNISQERVRDAVVPVPPKAEQQAIARAVLGACVGFDGLCADAGRAIELLLERRSALISAAVTGKIDVSGLAPQLAGTAA